HIWNCDEGLARYDGAQDIDARDDGAIIVRGPADKGENAAGRERNDAPLAVDDTLRNDPAETNPVLDALADPQQFDVREIAHATLPEWPGNSRRPRSVLAGVAPRCRQLCSRNSALRAAR